MSDFIWKRANEKLKSTNFKDHPLTLIIGELLDVAWVGGGGLLCLNLLDNLKLFEKLKTFFYFQEVLLKKATIRVKTLSGKWMRNIHLFVI